MLERHYSLFQVKKYYLLHQAKSQTFLIWWNLEKTVPLTTIRTRIPFHSGLPLLLRNQGAVVSGLELIQVRENKGRPYLAAQRETLRDQHRPSRQLVRLGQACCP